MRHHIHALIHRLCIDHTTVYCAVCGWWSAPHCH